MNVSGSTGLPREFLLEYIYPSVGDTDIDMDDIRSSIDLLVTLGLLMGLFFFFNSDADR
jgi:hypothetical protein